MLKLEAAPVHVYETETGPLTRTLLEYSAGNRAAPVGVAVDIHLNLCRVSDPPIQELIDGTLFVQLSDDSQYREFLSIDVKKNELPVTAFEFVDGSLLSFDQPGTAVNPAVPSPIMAHPEEFADECSSSLKRASRELSPPQRLQVVCAALALRSGQALEGFQLNQIDRTPLIIAIVGSENESLIQAICRGVTVRNNDFLSCKVGSHLPNPHASHHFHVAVHSSACYHLLAATDVP